MILISGIRMNKVLFVGIGFCWSQMIEAFLAVTSRGEYVAWCRKGYDHLVHEAFYFKHKFFGRQVSF